MTRSDSSPPRPDDSTERSQEKRSEDELREIVEQLDDLEALAHDVADALVRRGKIAPEERDELLREANRRSGRRRTPPTPDDR